MGFSVSSALRFGWETFKKRPWFFILATLVVGLVELLMELVAGAIAILFASSEKELLIVFFSAYFALGLVFGTLPLWAGRRFSSPLMTTRIKSSLPRYGTPRPYWKYLGAGILLLLVMLAGFLFATLLLVGVNIPLGLIAIVVAVVASVIFVLMFMFTLVIVIDRELGPIAAMKESHRITRGHKWRLAGLMLVFMLISLLWQGFNKVLDAPMPINLLGALAIVAALLVLSPVASLAVTRAYRVLSGAAGIQPADAALAA
jgi:hypothetical protein